MISNSLYLSVQLEFKKLKEKKSILISIWIKFDLKMPDMKTQFIWVSTAKDEKLIFWLSVYADETRLVWNGKGRRKMHNLYKFWNMIIIFIFY